MVELRTHQFHIMKNVSESLARRVGIIMLPQFSLREEYQIDFNEPFILTEEYFERRKNFCVIFLFRKFSKKFIEDECLSL